MEFGGQGTQVDMPGVDELTSMLGGLAVAYAPVAFLKVLLGCVLLAAAAKTIMHRPGG